VNADTLDGGIIPGGVKINAARGTGSLARQLARRMGASPEMAEALGDVVREGLDRSGIPDRDVAPVEIAERLGLIPKKGARRRK
jgi:hypothetical protein